MTHRHLRTIALVLALAITASPGRAGSDVGNGEPGAPDSPDPGITRLSTPTVEVPLDLSQGRPILRITIDGEGPFAFIVDTGAPFSVLDDGIARRLDLEVVGQQILRSPGASEEIEARQVRAGRMEAGGLRIEGPVLATMDLVGFSGGLLEGVLGLHHFRDLLLTFDSPGARLKIAPGKLDAGDEETIAFQEVMGHIRIPLETGGTVVPFDLDTGSPGGFTLPKAVESRLRFQEEPVQVGSIRLVGGEHPAWRARLAGSMQLAGIEYPAPEVTLTTLSEEFGNIGMGVLRDLEMTLDQAGGLVSFRRPTPTAGRQIAEGPRRGRRLGVAFAMTPDGFVVQDGGFSVRLVESGGPAAAAGLQVGDILLAVNGTRLADLEGRAEVGQLLGSPGALQLHVLREGETIQLEIP